MDDKQLDDLFRKGLQQPEHYARAEAQWAVVNKRLRGQRRRGAWWWSLVGFIFVLGTLTFLIIIRPLSSSTPDTPPNENAANPKLSITEPAIADNQDGSKVITPIEDESEKVAAQDRTYSAGHYTRVRALRARTRVVASSLARAREESPPINTPTPTTTPTADTSAQRLPQPPVATLASLQPSLANSVQTIECGFQLYPSLRIPGFYLEAGVQRSMLRSQPVQDSLPNGLYAGLGIRVRGRWGLEMQYQRAQKQRSTMSDPRRYGLTLPENIYPSQLPLSTDWRYVQHQLILGGTYHVRVQPKWQAQLSAGAQFSKRGPTQTTYVYEGIYAPDVIDTTQVASVTQLTAYYLGANVGVPIYQQWQLQLQYRYYLPWQTRSLPQHSAQLGLRYHF